MVKSSRLITITSQILMLNQQLLLISQFYNELQFTLRNFLDQKIAKMPEANTY